MSSSRAALHVLSQADSSLSCWGGHGLVEDGVKLSLTKDCACVVEDLEG